MSTKTYLPEGQTIVTEIEWLRCVKDAAEKLVTVSEDYEGDVFDSFTEAVDACNCPCDTESEEEEERAQAIRDECEALVDLLNWTPANRIDDD